jgi:FlgN protein
MSQNPPANDLQQMTNRLRDLLVREEEVLKNSRESLTRVHLALRRGDLESLDTARVEQERLAADLRDLSTGRMDAVRILAHAVGVPVERPALTEIADRLPSAQATELQSLRARMRTTVGEVVELQKTNANLVQTLRSFFRGVLSGLTAPETPTRYGPTGGRLQSIT